MEEQRTEEQERLAAIRREKIVTAVIVTIAAILFILFCRATVDLDGEFIMDYY